MISRLFRGANVKLGNWRQVTVQIRVFCKTNDGNGVWSLRGHTRECVQSPLVVLQLKVRKGGDFFYGKSSNENHIESL